MNRISEARLKKFINVGLGIDTEDLIYNYIYKGPVWNTFCYVRKIGRYIKRMCVWSIRLWDIEDWDYRYFYDVMKYQLEDIEKCLRDDNMHVGADKRALQVRVVLEHLKRYNNIEKYTINSDTMEYLDNTVFLPLEEEEVKVEKLVFEFKKTFPFLNLGYVEKIELKSSGSIWTHKDERLHKIHSRIHENQRKLEEWHLTEFFRKIHKQSRGWWV